VIRTYYIAANLEDSEDLGAVLAPIFARIATDQKLCQGAGTIIIEVKTESISKKKKTKKETKYREKAKKKKKKKP
jgi:hypothetical protein